MNKNFAPGTKLFSNFVPGVLFYGKFLIPSRTFIRRCPGICITPHNAEEKERTIVWNL